MAPIGMTRSYHLRLGWMRVEYQPSAMKEGD